MTDPRVFEINNYEINSFLICQAHNCLGTEISVYSENKGNESIANELKFFKIVQRAGHPNFHFEIDGKIYVYGLRAINADYTIVLRCLKCTHSAFISPSKILKEIIQNSPENSKNFITFKKSKKFLDREDPKVYDIKNYELHSLEIRGVHKCPGTELSVYFETHPPSDEIISDNNRLKFQPKKSNLDLTSVIRKCKLVKITNVRGNPILHFNINEKIYFYGIRGIKANYKIKLGCTKSCKKGDLKWVGCGTHSYI